MKTASEMTVLEYCDELRRRNDLQPVGDNFLLDLANRLSDSPQAPIGKLTVATWGPAGFEMYAPGLPPGDHELYCEPEVVAPYLRDQPGEKRE